VLSGEVSGESPVVCPASSTFYFISRANRFLLHAVAAGVFIFAAGDVFLLRANLTVYDIDPTARDPGAGELDPPGDAQHFPKKNLIT
jgi:hypothetical protein